MSLPSLATPSSDDQLRFLTNVQRLFAEGDFQATYKFALLSALADLAVESTGDAAEGLVVDTRQIADKFILLYWRQVLPYGNGQPATIPGVLIQNNGEQAAVVSAIWAFRQAHNVATPQLAKALPDYRGLQTKVAKTVSDQPLNFLQNFGGTFNAFLFERIGNGAIRLLPGAAYCLRQFYPLVQQLARANWIAHLKRNPRNQPILGQADDLAHFLFAASRQSLVAMAVGLKKLDGPNCFYCRLRIDDADVDHFIPFSHYPRDLAHNFVLAHPRCNRSKSDTLAAKPHLERWMTRLATQSDAIAKIGQDAGLTVDGVVTLQIAWWRYGTAIRSGASAWHKPKQYELIGADYAAYFLGA